MPTEGFETHDWFQKLYEDVQRELVRRQEQPDRSANALVAEAEQLQRQVQGWSMSLANPDLPTATRRMIEQQLQDASERMADIEAIQAAKQAQQQQAESILDPNAVRQRLDRLHEVLSAHNPSRANIELSLHIQRIDCYSSGRVVLRTCRLGVLADAMDFFATDPPAAPTDEPHASDTHRVTPRRLARRRVASGDSPTDELKALAAWSTDPHRFDGLDEQWFEETEFQVPERTYWFQDHAAQIAAKRAEGLSYEQLAEQFGCTPSTVRKALRYAVEQDPTLAYLLERKPRPRWHEDHVHDVLPLYMQGWTVPQLAEHFEKSEPTIGKAIEYAAQIGLLTNGGHEG